jgi:hypothetical protein
VPEEGGLVAITTYTTGLEDLTQKFSGKPKRVSSLLTLGSRAKGFE